MSSTLWLKHPLKECPLNSLLRSHGDTHREVVKSVKLLALYTCVIKTFKCRSLYIVKWIPFVDGRKSAFDLSNIQKIILGGTYLPWGVHDEDYCSRLNHWLTKVLWNRFYNAFSIATKSLELGLYLSGNETRIGQHFTFSDQLHIFKDEKKEIWPGNSFCYNLISGSQLCNSILNELPCLLLPSCFHESDTIYSHTTLIREKRSTKLPERIVALKMQDFSTIWSGFETQNISWFILY